jgi:nitrite reductase/ring-hydroxylating ferredoxin subunit
VPAVDSVRDLVDRLAGVEALDKLGKPVATWVGKVVGTGPTKDLLSGTWMGHPLHPMLTDLPIGFWTGSFMLDLVGGARSQRASQRLIALGILSALPTAAAGFSDWSDTIGEDRRLGTAHALGNTAALTLYTLSWRARRKGRRGRGVLLGFLGAGAATAGGYLGGHLVFRRGVGPDRNAWKERADDWVDAGEETGLVASDAPMVVRVGDDDVLVVRNGAGYSAISNICGHAGGPLNEGTFDDHGCVTCPWHGSVFRLADGHVVHGPATGNQPRYDVRTSDGRLLVRRHKATV